MNLKILTKALEKRNEVIVRPTYVIFGKKDHIIVQNK